MLNASTITTAFDIFISHSSKDRKLAEEVCRSLELRGMRCWIAPRNIPLGMDFVTSIMEAIGQCRLLVLVLTEQANRSLHVHREIQRAGDEGLPILPIMIEKVALSPQLQFYVGSAQWLNATTRPLHRHLERLADHAQGVLARSKAGNQLSPPPPSPPPPPEEDWDTTSDRTASMDRDHPSPNRLLWLSLGLSCLLLLGATVTGAIYFTKGRGPVNLSKPNDAPAKVVARSSSENPDQEAQANAAYVEGRRRIDRDRLQEAIEAFTQALELNPDHIEALANRGITYIRTGQSAKAIPDFTAMIHLRPAEYKAYSFRAQAHAKTQQFDKAVADFSEAIRLKKDAADLYLMRAHAQLCLGNYSEVIDDSNQCLQLDPKRALAYCYRSRAQQHLGDAEKAQADFDSAVRLNSSVRSLLSKTECEWE